MFICLQIAFLVQDNVLNLVHNDVHNVHKIINVILPVLFRLKINNEELRIMNNESEKSVHNDVHHQSSSQCVPHSSWCFSSPW